MKNIFIIMLFIHGIAKAQLQDEYFVDDAIKIDLVTVKYCVDGNGNTTTVNLVPEKTNYKNLDNISASLEFFSKIVYEPNSEWTNKCHEYSLRFINAKYKDKVLTPEEMVLCEKFKTGNFSYDKLVFPNCKILRTPTHQIETNAGVEMKYEIEWLAPNLYKLKMIGNTENFELNVEIIDIDGDEYICRSTSGGLTLTTVMRKVN